MTSIILLIGWLIIGVLALFAQFVKKAKPSWIMYWAVYAMTILSLIDRVVNMIAK